MSRIHRTVQALLLALPLLGACAGGDAAQRTAMPEDAPEAAASTAPLEVLVRARDFSYVAPDTIPSGPITFRLLNEGPDFHHLELVRLEEGKTAADLMRRLTSGPAPWPSWAVEAGGPMTPNAPGGETSATLDLAPGDYAMICVIPAPDGELHIVKGMMRPLTVVPSEGPARGMPEVDLVMTLDDYSFETDRPITPGTHTIRVVDAAVQAHEVVIVKLAPGKEAGDFLRWVEKREGPAPGEIVGGATGLARGEDNVITVEFEAGRYALLCFVPDHEDGRPHFLHGMVKEIEIG